MKRLYLKQRYYHGQKRFKKVCEYLVNRLIPEPMIMAVCLALKINDSVETLPLKFTYKGVKIFLLVSQILRYNYYHIDVENDKAAYHIIVIYREYGVYEVTDVWLEK